MDIAVEVGGRQRVKYGNAGLQVGEALYDSVDCLGVVVLNGMTMKGGAKSYATTVPR